MTFETSAVNTLGFVGFFAAGLLPYRCWRLMAAVANSRVPKWQLRFLFASAAMICAISLWFEVQICSRIFQCLTESYCGPGIASGWGYFAMLGVAFVSFEVAAYLRRKLIKAKNAGGPE